MMITVQRTFKVNSKTSSLWKKEKSGTIDRNTEIRKKSVGRVGEVWWMGCNNISDSSTQRTIEHTKDCVQQGAGGVHLNL